MVCRLTAMQYGDSESTMPKEDDVHENFRSSSTDG